MNEPEPWSFKDEEDQFKRYESQESSTDDSDEELFTKSKKLKHTKFKKIVEPEKLSFE
jgi:hypothetical protein